MGGGQKHITGEEPRKWGARGPDSVTLSELFLDCLIGLVSVSGDSGGSRIYKPGVKVEAPQAPQLSVLGARIEAPQAPRGEVWGGGLLSIAPPQKNV